MYAKLRKDEQGRPMDVVVLRGNSESPEAIHGYETVSTAPVKPGEPVISSHTRPSWMQRILDNYAQGIRTILFLDELTTANEYVQAALLMLIFDRKCGVEKLPPIEYCLIVAAGNYMNNLTTSMTMISPVLNRFMIFNVTPGPDDLGDFLCKYKGAMTSGKLTDPMIEVEKQLEALDQQELKMKLSESNLNKCGEFFERSISETTRLLMTKGGKIDLSVTNLKDLYGDVDDDDPNLYGFPTFRTLNYLRDVSIACYKCFGKAGIQSDNFRAMINGLVGIGLTKETKGSQTIIKTHKIGADYHESLSKTAIELDKLSNSKLPEYVDYFTEMVNTVTSKERESKLKGKFSIPEMQAFKNKMVEMCGDSDMKNIERPLEADLVGKLGDILDDSSNLISAVKIDSSATGSDFSKSLVDSGLTTDVVIGYVGTWNTLVSAYNSFHKFINLDQWKYPTTTKDSVSNVGKSLSKTGMKLKAMKRIIMTQNPGSANLIPDITVPVA